jgi:hypothetical protein
LLREEGARTGLEITEVVGIYIFEDLAGNVPADVELRGAALLALSP